MTLLVKDSGKKPTFLVGENYQLSLKRRLKELLAETHKKTPDFSGFTDAFYDLMQAKIDPLLESIWVFSALSFQSHNFGNEDPLNRLSVIKDLFQLVSSCSTPCNSSKSIALLAPIVFEVYKLVVEVLGKDLDSKGGNKVNKKIKCLVEVITGYISMCCCKDLNEKSEGIDVNLLIPVEDLVSLWMDRNVNLKSFFPLVGDEVLTVISERGFDVNYLAGIVMVEAILLKLCLDLRIGSERIVMEKELRSWVVASISSFNNFYFFEILVRMLLQSALPVTALLGPKDGGLLRSILYDAVILVEYSFLKSETFYLPPEHAKSIAMTRLIVTLEAIELYRKNGDQKRAACHTSAFTNSLLPSQITKWISCLLATDEKAGGRSGSSPKDFTKWLLKLEKQGIKIFNDSILKYHAKLLVDDDSIDEQSISEVEKKPEDDPLFYIDNKGEEEEQEEKEDEEEDEENKMKSESMTAAFVAAAHSMRQIDKSKKKRKGKGNEEKRKIKYIKHDLSSNPMSAKKKVLGAVATDDDDDDDDDGDDDDQSSESEVENPGI